MKYLLLYLFTLISSFKNISRIDNSINLYINPKIVYIQPLGDVKDKYVSKVVSSIENFYGFKCVSPSLCKEKNSNY